MWWARCENVWKRPSLCSGAMPIPVSITRNVAAALDASWE